MVSAYPELRKLPEKLQNLIQSEIEGEYIEWVGQPNPGRSALRGIGISIFGLAFGGFAVFWIVMAWTGTHHTSAKSDLPSGFQIAFPLFGVPFLLVGAALFLTPLWNWIKAKKTVYLITNKRAIIFEPELFNTTIHSYNPQQIANRTKKIKSGNLGDIIFEQEFTRSRSTYPIKEIGFLNVENVNMVDEILARLVEK